MFWLRSCPRCKGDFYQDRDAFGYYLTCLQCGHEIQLSRGLELEEELSPVLLEQLQLRADASRMAAEERHGRPARHRKVLKVA